MELLLQGRIRFAIASDIGEEPLAHARRTADAWDCHEGIDFRLGSGLRCVAPGEADTIVIAGMGGDKIVAILSEAPWTKENVFLLLQPMSRAEVLRAWLPENGYTVTAEQLVADKGIIYPILSVRGGSMPPAADADAWGGFLLREDPLWGMYLDGHILRLRKAAAGLAHAKDPVFREKQERLSRTAEVLERWKGEWQHAHST